MTNEAKTLKLRIQVTKTIFDIRENSEDFKQIMVMLRKLGLSEAECGFFSGMSWAVDGFPGVPDEIRKQLIGGVIPWDSEKEDGDARPD